jgi:UMF1 family MFS transporter
MATQPAAASQAAPHAVILEAPAAEERISPVAVGSWALYDFANTIFSMNIVSVFFPGFIIQLGLRDAAYAFPMSAALLVVALIMPVLGAMSDRAGRRIPWLAGFTLLCIVMTVLMGLTDQIWLLIGAYVVASIGYQTALVFYDALLPSVSNTVNWGKVSGLGVGLGYAGAVAGLYAVTMLVAGGSKQNAFIPSALLFLLFALPCFFFVREHRYSSTQTVEGERMRVKWREAVSQTWRTIQHAREVPGLFRFLIANFFYSDALNTVIVAMGVYATVVIGFGTELEVLGPATVAAVIGSWLFGFVTDRLTSKQSLIISLLMWVGVFLAAMFVTDKVLFQWVVAPVAGIALGSTWTAARTMMVELSPPERLGEFMGIYNLTGKFAAVLGPALWGGTLLVLDPREYGRFAYQIAIGTLLVMVLIGFVLHLFTPNIKRVKHVS